MSASILKRAVARGANYVKLSCRLNNCINDVTWYNTALTAAGFDVRVLAEDDYTHANVIDVWKWLAEVPAGGVIADLSSGHGTQYPDYSDAGGVCDAECPVDCDPSDPNTLLRDQDFVTFYRTICPAVRMIKLDDSCFAGGEDETRKMLLAKRPPIRFMYNPALRGRRFVRRRGINVPAESNLAFFAAVDWNHPASDGAGVNGAFTEAVRAEVEAALGLDGLTNQQVADGASARCATSGYPNPQFHGAGGPWPWLG